MPDVYTKEESRHRSCGEPGVTVIVPCYNGEQDLKRTVDSLLDQECLPDEILIVDDGSKDGTRAIATSYGGIVRVISQENSGTASARYTGVVNATNDILIFIDAGDTARATKVRLLKTALMENPDCVCSFGVAWNTQQPQPKLSRITSKPLDGSFTVVSDPFSLILGQFWPVVHGMDLAIWRHTALKSADIPPFYKAGNDYAVQIKTARFGPFVHVAEITSEFVYIPKGLTSQFGLSLQIGFALCAAIDVFESSPLAGGEQLLKERVISGAPRGLIAAHLKQNRELAKRLIRAQLKYGSMVDFPKRCLWELKRSYQENELGQARFLRAFARLLIYLSGAAR